MARRKALTRRAPLRQVRPGCHPERSRGTVSTGRIGLPLLGTAMWKTLKGGCHDRGKGARAASLRCVPVEVEVACLDDRVAGKARGCGLAGRFAVEKARFSSELSNVIERPSAGIPD